MTERKPFSLPNLRAKPKDEETPELIAALDAAGDRVGFTMEEPKPAPKRGAPVRVTRKDPRRVSIELDGAVYKRLQLLGVERGEKLQAMCEQAILDFLRKYENK